MKSRVWLWLSVFGFLLLMFVAVGFAAPLGPLVIYDAWRDGFVSMLPQAVEIGYHISGVVLAATLLGLGLKAIEKIM